MELTLHGGTSTIRSPPNKTYKRKGQTSSNDRKHGEEEVPHNRTCGRDMYFSGTTR